MRVQRGAASASTAAMAAALLCAVLVTGCASHGRVASVASSFLPLTNGPVPAGTSGSGSPSSMISGLVPETRSFAPSGVVSPSRVGSPPGVASPSVLAPPDNTASAVLASPPSDDDGGFSSATPCPVPSPQQFVHGTSATTAGDGSVVFNYRTAQRLCGGPDDGRFVTIGKTDLHATVDPSALVFLLPPDGTTKALQVPVAAIPAAMAANNQAPYYAITFNSAGSITGIEQYFHP